MYFILKNATFSNAIGTISVQEGNVGGGGNGGSTTPTNVTFTINPTPSNATVTLTASGYTQSGNSITVLSGTKVSYTVSASGYTTKSGSKTVSYTQSLGIVLSAAGSGGTNPPSDDGSGSGGNDSDNVKVYTLNIDLSNSDPDTCCSYADDAIGMTAKSSDWDSVFGHYPVLMKDGAEVVKLNPSDYTKDINGNTVDIGSGDAGDVMVAFPRMGLKISKANNIITVSFTNDTNNSDYGYLAHTHNGDLDKFYVGAYDGYIDGDGKLRSLSGKTPTSDKTIGEFRSAAQLNGSGYEQFAYYQWTYLQAMYLMKYHSLNGQTALGAGYTNNGNSSAIATGTMNDKGLDYGGSDTEGMKFAGIENFWGNIYKWCDGIVTDASYNYLTTTGDFNDSGSDYEYTSPSGFTSNSFGYVSDVVGTTEGGFAMTAKAGSTTTYFSDGSICYASRVAYCGGYWSNGSDAGPFFLCASYSASDARAYVGARVQKL